MMQQPWLNTQEMYVICAFIDLHSYTIILYILYAYKEREWENNIGLLVVQVGFNGKTI